MVPADPVAHATPPQSSRSAGLPVIVRPVTVDVPSRSVLAGDPTLRRTGLSHDQLRHLRSLIEQRGRIAWQIGDILVAAYGAPGPAVTHDGTSRRLEVLGEELGCSASWLTACRAAAAAFPERERRPSVAWSVHRHLAARHDRVALLDRFVTACERDGATPSLRLLTDWLDQLDAGRRRGRTIGRPRTDPVVRVERLALRLEHDDLRRLISRLSAALAVQTAA